MQTILVVGCVRSGLSLTMQLLDAAGVPCVGTYPAYEVYPVGGIPWGSVRGTAVKVVDTDKQYPPEDYSATYVYLHRDGVQQAYSFLKFLRYFGVDTMVPTDEIVRNFEESYARIDGWLAEHSRGRVVHLRFEDLIERPIATCKTLVDDLALSGVNLDRLVQRIIPRRSACHAEMLEAYLVSCVVDDMPKR